MHLLLRASISKIDTPVGSPIPDMALTIILCLIVNVFACGERGKNE